MKKVVAVVILILTVVTVYFFFPGHEFKVSFEAKTTPGDLIETLRLWNRSSNGISEITAIDSVSKVMQQITLDGRQYIYIWEFASKDDSTTEVTAKVSQPGHRFMNKLLVPISSPDIERDAAAIVNKFYLIVKTHLNLTKVKIVGEAEMPSRYCVCSMVETDQIDKANGMMKDFPLLTSFIQTFRLKPDGPPLIEVQEWNHSTGSLKYHFCFPIVKSDSLPASKSVFYKNINSGRALKAEYYGNYITSDRAWYALLAYAKSKGYPVKSLPTELFYDNPNMGMKETEWKAEVFLPVSEK